MKKLIGVLIMILIPSLSFAFAQTMHLEYKNGRHMTVESYTVTLSNGYLEITKVMHLWGEEESRPDDLPDAISVSLNILQRTGPLSSPAEKNQRPFFKICIDYFIGGQECKFVHDSSLEMVPGEKTMINFVVPKEERVLKSIKPEFLNYWKIWILGEKGPMTFSPPTWVKAFPDPDGEVGRYGVKIDDMHPTKINEDYVVFYYDKESLTRIKPDIVRVWIKEWNVTAAVTIFGQFFKDYPDIFKGVEATPPPKDAKEAQAHMDKWNKYVESFKKEKPSKTTEKPVWDRRMMLWEIKCEARMARMLKLTTYDSEGNVIGSGLRSPLNWDYIIPETVGEKIWKIFCNEEKPKLNIEPVPEADPVRAIPF